jgi:hypothetical protein
MIFFNFFLMIVDPAHHKCNIKLTENVFQFFFIYIKILQRSPYHHRTLSNQTDVDRHQHKAEARHSLLHVQGTCHGYPCGHRNSDYKGKVPLCSKVLMLTLTKEQLALQECVEGSAAKRHTPTQVRPIKLGAGTDRLRRRVWT